MALTPYCTNDEVRAVLGITVSELSDATLNLPIYSSVLWRELVKVDQGLPSVFSTLNALSTPTVSEKSLLISIQLFSALTAARSVAPSLALMAPKTLSDDKASFTRFSDAALTELIASVSSQWAKARSDLLSDLATYNSTTAPTPVAGTSFVAAPRGYDPVSGE